MLFSSDFRARNRVKGRRTLRSGVGWSEGKKKRMFMSHSQRNAGLIFFAVVLVRLAFHVATGFVADDAFITYRYAQNIAAGHGFVYNVGERVLGTPSPLFTLIVSFFVVLRLGAVYGALLVSILASGITAAVLYRFAEWLRFGRLWIIPVLLYALWPLSLIAETSGMPTAVYTMLVIVAFYYAYSHRPYYALAAATLATVTLPEGALVLVLVLIASVVRYPRRWFSFVGVPAVILAPWLIFADWYFGSPVPHTITAHFALYSQVNTGGPWDRLTDILALGQIYGWVLLAAAVLGIIWLWQSQRFGIIEGLWFAGTIAFYTLTTTDVLLWYVAPLFPMYLLFASGVLVWLFDRVDWLHEHQGNLVPFLSLILLIVLGIADGRAIMDYRQKQKQLDYTHEAMALYIRTHSAEGVRVAAEDIGYIGHFSGRRILDREGLVSPEAVPYNRAGQYGQLIHDYQPDFVVVSSDSPISGFVADSAFTAEYELERTYQYAPSNQYRLYQRRTLSQAVQP